MPSLWRWPFCASFSNFGHQRHSNQIMVSQKDCHSHNYDPPPHEIGGINGKPKKYGRNIFSPLFQFLNAILDQFVDRKLCIVMYYKFTVHKLVQNCILKLKFAKKRYQHPAKLRLSRSFSTSQYSNSNLHF